MKTQAPKHSFKEIRGNRKAYAKYGDVATYANRTQAENKLAELRALGYDCFMVNTRPFFIILNQNTQA